MSEGAPRIGGEIRDQGRERRASNKRALIGLFLYGLSSFTGANSAHAEGKGERTHDRSGWQELSTTDQEELVGVIKGYEEISSRPRGATWVRIKKTSEVPVHEPVAPTETRDHSGPTWVRVKDSSNQREGESSELPPGPEKVERSPTRLIENVEQGLDREAHDENQTRQSFPVELPDVETR